MKSRLRLDDERLTIGDWVLDPTTQRLVRGTQVRLLNPKEMAVTQHLARAAPALVPTDELLDMVWPDVVVGDHAVHDVIGRLRRKLGDSARWPTYIETRPKRGYRMIAPVVRGIRRQPHPPSAEGEVVASEAVSRAIFEFNRLAIENPEVNEVLVKGMGDVSQLSEYERNRFNALANVLFYGWQRTFYALRESGLESETWQGQVRSLRTILGNPGFRHRWEQLKPYLGSSFRSFVEERVLNRHES